MDTDQQEFKSIGFWGIIKKTFKIIYKERMIFTKITLSSILPLTIIITLGYPHLIIYEYIHIKSGIILLPALAGIILAIIFFLLPTSAIHYAIARTYTTKQFTFRTIFLKVVPKAWVRLMVTFAIQFLIMFAYNFVTILFLISSELLLSDDWIAYSQLIFVVLYLIGLVYISVIWSLANVVTLLEDLKGYGAIKKSKALLKGKRLVAISLFLLTILPVVVGHIVLFVIVLINWYIKGKVGCEDTCLLVSLGLGLILPMLILPMLILLGLVVQTIFYFVCKSYHHEIIDKFYLEIHLDNFVPAASSVTLVETNVQLEHSNI